MRPSYRKKIRTKILLQNILIISCLFFIGIFIYLKVKPEITGFAVKDECGPIGNTISHSIDDDEACQNSCNSACKSYGMIYHNSEFVYNLERECNNCTCYCK